MNVVRARRHVVVVDNTALAKAIGGRIRQARQAAGLTQRELAGDRYTPAYISALETGSAKPSMAALHYIAGRLGTDAQALMTAPAGRVRRSQADLLLAAGDWQPAADLYRTLLEGSGSERERAELLLGLAEALCRLDQGRDALALATEAQDVFARTGQAVPAGLATYWMAAANHQMDNSAEARRLLADLLTAIRGGLEITADFRVRVLVAAAMAESQDGEHERALAYLEEARALQGEMDDLRRARYLFRLAVEYQETGDYEAALRTGAQSAALFTSAEAIREIAAVENLTALTYADMGNAKRALAALARAQELAGALPGDERAAANFAETEARVRLAADDLEGAAGAADRAIELARQAGSQRTVADAQLSKARILERRNRPGEALELYREAVETARQRGGRALLRRTLSAHGDALARAGRLAEATASYQEALKA
jgi:tetratricopeptide (TPR) repeat protein